MADTKSTREEAHSGWMGSAAKAFDFWASIRLFFSGMKESIAEGLDMLLRRVEYLFLVYLWVSAGLLLMVLGIFDLLVDFGKVPRGVVFSLGGLFIVLVATIFLQAAKIKKRRK
jgi:hypothetical protein